MANKSKGTAKKQKQLATILVIILIVAIVGMVIFAYYQGWFDSFFEEPVKLDSISATYKGEDLFEGQSVDKNDVEVVAHYTNQTNKKVSDFSVGKLQAD